MTMKASDFIVGEYPKTTSPGYIESFIDSIHTGGGHDEELLNWIYAFRKYNLVRIALSSLALKSSALKQPKVDQYSKETGDFPPIIIDGNNNWIIDGYHRANAAAKRGDTTILAYIGKE